MDGAPLPTCHPVSASVAEPAAPISSDQYPNPRTGLSRLNTSSPFPYLSLFLLGMLSGENDSLVVPFVGTCSVMVEERVISIVVVRDDTSSWLELVTTLMGEGTISALMPIQETIRPAPVTGGPFSSFRQSQVGVRSGRSGEGHAWSLRALYESRDKT
jgi:hypothetical protein